MLDVFNLRNGFQFSGYHILHGGLLGKVFRYALLNFTNGTFFLNKSTKIRYGHRKATQKNLKKLTDNEMKFDFSHLFYNEH